MDIRILIPAAQGTEDMELVVMTDLFRRAGFGVKIAGENEIVTCSKGLKILPDILLEEIDDDVFYDAVVIPGGRDGVNRLSQNEYFLRILKRQLESGRLTGAICAAPLLLHDNKILPAGIKLTSHPSVKAHLSDYNYSEEKIADDLGFVTSRGAGTAIEFSLYIIEKLAGREIAENVSESIVFTY